MSFFFFFNVHFYKCLICSTGKDYQKTIKGHFNVIQCKAVSVCKQISTKTGNTEITNREIQLQKQNKTKKLYIYISLGTVTQKNWMLYFYPSEK